jgi:photosystem II stability/assembly factor-like uncharacterized protein
MKKQITLLITLAFLLSNICFSQSGWVSKFFNNSRSFTRILQRDSNNYIALCSSSKYYYKSSDAGNNWVCIEDYAFDSIYIFSDGQFLNAQTGWIVGSNTQFNNGVILKTTNGGLNWIRQNTGFNNYHCYCMCFLNTNTGWVGTSGGTVGQLLRSTNGGTNWTKQDFPGAYNVRSVKFFDNNNGWILGSYGLIARTTDGGLTWLQKPVNDIPCSNSSYTTLFALSTTESWVLVGCVNYGMVYSHFFETTNGGNNWALMYSYTDSMSTNGNSFSKINFINSMTGFSNGSFSSIIRTTNSGINWNRINVGSGGTYPIICSLLPINNNEIFAGGGYSNLGSYRPFNYILKSTNTGLNWSYKTYNWEYNFPRILFTNISTGFVISDTGKIFKTSNSGSNWNLVFDNNSYWFREISFVNSSTGCIAGSPHFYDYYGRILRTTNSGMNWIETFSSSTLRIFSIKFSDQQNGWVGCDSNRLLKTTNAGLNWSLISLTNSTPYDFVSISFINNTTGWLLGHYYYGIWPWPYEKNEFLKTTNSGINWNILGDSLGFIYNYYIQFVDNNTGFKLSWIPTRIQKTTNGGVNWYIMSLPYSVSPACSYFVNINTGWVAGSNGQFSGEVIKTTNSGLSWTLQFNEYNKIVNSILAIDSSKAWFCGDYSSIYTTTNGGGIIGVNNINIQLLRSFSLSQNYPNPFNPVTRIKFYVPKFSNVKLVIYDVLGREIETLIDENKKPGSYEVDWDGSRYASGVYFYKLITNDFVETKKMVLIK